MIRSELLKEYLEREMHNVFCYSASWKMDTPKKGYEKEFWEAKQKAELLEEMIRDEEERMERLARAAAAAATRR